MKISTTIYGLSFASVVVAGMIRWLLDPVLGEQLPYPTFFVAVIVAAWIGGLRPALFATGLGFFVSWYCFIPPRFSLSGTSGPHFLGLAMYLMVSFAIAAFGEAMRVGQRRFEELAQQNEGTFRPTSVLTSEAILLKHSLRDVAVIGLGLILAVLVTGGVVGYRSVRQLNNDRQMVANSHEVIGALESLLSILKDAESGQRDYLLTEDEKYLEPYDDALKRVRRQVRHIEELSSDNPDQQARLPALDEKIEVRLEELIQTVALMKAGNRAAALKVVRADTGKASMDGVRKEIAAMRELDEQLLRIRAAASEGSYRNTVLSVLLPAVIGAILVGAVFALSQRNIRQRQRAAFAIAEQKERLKTTLASIGDGVITTDADGNVTYLNAIAESLTGWKSRDAAGLPLTRVFRIVNESTRQPVENPAFRSLKEGTIVGLANHTILISKDGKEWPIDDSAAPIRCVEGELVGCVLVFRDITERKRVDEKIRVDGDRLLMALTAAHMVAWEYDPATGGVITSTNAAEVFGFPSGESIGNVERAFAMLHPEDVDGHRATVVAAVESGEDFFSQYRIVRPDTGAVRWMEARGFAVRAEADGILRFVGVVMDTTDRKRSEDERQRLVSIIENSRDFIGISDAEGKPLFLNRAGRELVGLEYTHDIRRTAIVDFFVPEQRRFVNEVVLPATTTDGRWFGELTFRHFKTAAAIPVLYDHFRVDDPKTGKPINFATVTRDISARKRTEESVRASEARFRAAVGAVSSIIWTNNAEGMMEGEQPGWGEFTGQMPEDYQGYGWSKAVHPEDAQPTIHHWNLAVAEKKIFEFEHRVRRCDGEWRLCSIRAVPVMSTDGTIGEWVGVHTDITEQRMLESDLRRLAADLSEADRRKDEFLATLAHELRNPLAPIRNGLQVMKLAESSAEAVAQSRTIMERQLGQMVRLVDDLMDVSRISQGKLELKMERIQLAAVVNSAIETSRPLIDQMGHELAVTLPEQPVVIDADLTRLAQVFMNLLNNASKYSDRGSHIRVTAERQGSDVVVSVRDTGIGIAADQLPRIFEMFSQVDRSLEKSQGGLGIGLTLVRRLVEMHGGRVEAQSEGPGKGSEFAVRLPVVAGASVPYSPGIDEEQTAPKSALRILIVDDNRDGADSLSMMLKIMGNDTRTAYDGEEAVVVAGEFRPAVILLDIGLPKLNGYEACRRIREQTGDHTLVIIAQTGWGQDEDRQRSYDAGFDHHLVKPVDPVALMEMLSGLSDVAK